MTMLLIVFIIIGVLFAVMVSLANKNKGRSKGETPIKARSVLTMNEQPTFLRLREALPDCFILAQVAHSALVTASGQATRNRFNRARADFVVLDKKFKVLAVVELDDASHKSNAEKDGKRDTILKDAGYRIIRYPRTPEIEKIKSDFGIMLTPQQQVSSNVQTTTAI